MIHFYGKKIGKKQNRVTKMIPVDEKRAVLPVKLK